MTFTKKLGFLGQLSTCQLTDASGNVTDTYTYDAFGLLINRSGAMANNYIYTGEQYDLNEEFYYLRVRYYNQSNGRFLTMDTWAGSMFEPASLHKYLYCAGNPVGNWDPSGEKLSSLVEFSLAMSISSVILSTIYISANKLLNWLSPKKEPVIWTGRMIIVSYSPGGIINPTGWAVILTGLTGSHNGKELNWAYLIVLFGLTLAITDWNGSYPLGGIELETPGLLGLNYRVLCGPSAWASIAGAFVWGQSKTNFWMGLGHAYFPMADIIGLETGIDVMYGYSFSAF